MPCFGNGSRHCSLPLAVTCNDERDFVVRFWLPQMGVCAVQCALSTTYVRTSSTTIDKEIACKTWCCVHPCKMMELAILPGCCIPACPRFY